MAARRLNRLGRILAVLSGNFLDEARKLYGSFVDLYEEPELNKLFADAFVNQWSVDEFLQRFEQTEWAKTRTEAQEQFDLLEASKPEEATAQVDTYKALVRTTVGQLGLQIGDEQMTQIARMAARNKWSGQQFASGVGAEAVRMANAAGEQAPVAAQELRQIAQDYGVPVSDNLIRQWANEVSAGLKTTEQWVQEQRRNAQNLYTPIADRLETQTFRQITEPYRQLAGQTLEMDPEGLDLTQAKWARLFAPNPENPAEQRIMNLTEWAGFVRSQPEWQNTRNAYREYSDMAQQLENIFRGRR